MCTGVDAEECARMANVLSVQNSVQAEEIASLRGLLETCTSHRNQRVYHEKILEPMDIVDHSPHGIPTASPPVLLPMLQFFLYSCLYSSIFSMVANCLYLALKPTADADLFDSRYLTFICFVLPI